MREASSGHHVDLSKRRHKPFFRIQDLILEVRNVVFIHIVLHALIAIGIEERSFITVEIIHPAHCCFRIGTGCAESKASDLNTRSRISPHLLTGRPNQRFISGIILLTV